MNLMSEKVLNGYMIIGNLTTAPNGILIGQLIAGAFDEDIKCAIHFHETGEYPTVDTDLSGKPEAFLESIKEGFREMVAESIKAEEERLEKAHKASEAASNFAAMHESHTLGTVAEIAEKYGISKKKVRKLKKEGRLEEYVASLDAEG